VGAPGGVAIAEAGVAAGIAGEAVIGAAENAAFTAMGGGSAKEILTSAVEGGLFGGAFGALGSGLGSALGSFARRGAGELEETLDEAGSVGRSGCSCFVAGTEVATADGPRAIETIEPGTRVWASAEGARESRLQAVTATFHRIADEVFRVSLENEVIEATPEHRFWVDGRGWLAAGDLAVGDLLVDLEGNHVAILDLDGVQAPLAVYNLEVESTHTYHVGRARVLVHNPSCTRATRAQLLDRFGVDTANLRGGRRIGRRPDRYGFGIRRYGPPAPGMPEGRFVDFGGFVQRSARITYTGRNALDFAQADRIAFGSAPAGRAYRHVHGLTWHHVGDFDPETWEGTAQLVDGRLHAETQHFGGEWQARQADPSAYP
jgi:hypothetical protein